MFITFVSKVNSGDVDCHSLILTRCDTPDLKGLTSWVHSAWWCHALHCIWLVDCYILRFLFFFFFLSFLFHSICITGTLLCCSFAAFKFSIVERESCCCASSWRIRIDPDHRCRDATALSLVDQLSQCVKTYRFFLDGVDLCKQRSCIHRTCHALSFDLSVQRASLDLIWWEERWIQMHPWRRARGPVIGFHQHLLRHLHQPYHILHLLALRLHHAHQLAMPSNTDMLSEHSIGPFIPASSIRDSPVDLPRRSGISWCYPHLWVRPQSSLARG